MPRVLLICASLRSQSYNARLLQRIAVPLGKGCEIDHLLPSEVNLPLFDQDLEHDAQVKKSIAQIHARFAAADGLVIASPEYNGQPTAYLKNLVDWVSRMAYVHPEFANPFLDRPTLLCSASTGSSGGTVAIPTLRALMGYVGAIVIGDTICLPFAQHQWVESQGFDLDPYLCLHIDAAASKLTSLAIAFSMQRNDAHANIAPQD